MCKNLLCVFQEFVAGIRCHGGGIWSKCRWKFSKCEGKSSGNWEEKSSKSKGCTIWLEVKLPEVRGENQVNAKENQRNMKDNQSAPTGNQDNVKKKCHVKVKEDHRTLREREREKGRLCRVFKSRCVYVSYQIAVTDLTDIYRCESCNCISEYNPSESYPVYVWW